MIAPCSYSSFFPPMTQPTKRNGLSVPNPTFLESTTINAAPTAKPRRDVVIRMARKVERPLVIQAIQSFPNLKYNSIVTPHVCFAHSCDVIKCAKPFVNDYPRTANCVFVRSPVRENRIPTLISLKDSPATPCICQIAFRGCRAPQSRTRAPTAPAHTLVPLRGKITQIRPCNGGRPSTRWKEREHEKRRGGGKENSRP